MLMTKEQAAEVLKPCDHEYEPCSESIIEHVRYWKCMHCHDVKGQQLPRRSA